MFGQRIGRFWCADQFHFDRTIRLPSAFALRAVRCVEPARAAHVPGRVAMHTQALASATMRFSKIASAKITNNVFACLCMVCSVKFYASACASCTYSGTPSRILKGKVTPSATVIDKPALACGTAMRIAVGAAI